MTIRDLIKYNLIHKSGGYEFVYNKNLSFGLEKWDGELGDSFSWIPISPPKYFLQKIYNKQFYRKKEFKQ